MSKRVLIAVAIAATVAAGMLVGIVSASGGTTQAPGLQAWAFGAWPIHGDRAAHHPSSPDHAARPRPRRDALFDNAPAGTSQGDVITVEGLLSKRHLASTIGRLDVNEVFTGLPPGGGARLLVTVTASLAAGQITAIGVGRVSGSGTITIKLPIAGGTGKYRNVGGVLIANANGNTTLLTYLLIP